MDFRAMISRISYVKFSIQADRGSIGVRWPVIDD